MRLNATVLRPYYPASDMFRVVRDDDGPQVDFMATIRRLALPVEKRMDFLRKRVGVRGSAL